MPAPNPTHLDVLIVGAGISGISAAYHLQTRCPRKTYAILEARPTGPHVCEAGIVRSTDSLSR